uniref:C2H2-type domain-containing protein n=1 Tax=Macrostomum lignano TaxID=282301 RepID=A0A1I8FTE5_9PLAT
PSHQNQRICGQALPAAEEVLGSSLGEAADEIDDINKYLHRCPLCSAKFVNKISMSRHVRTHHIDDDQFNCGLCGKAFDNHLAKHRLEKHSRLLSLRQGRPVSASVSASVGSSRPFACQHCPYQSTTLGNLRAHELCRHSDMLADCAVADIAPAYPEAATCAVAHSAAPVAGRVYAGSARSQSQYWYRGCSGVLLGEILSCIQDESSLRLADPAAVELDTGAAVADEAFL